MGKKDVTAEVRRSFVVRSTKASAKLERRVVPDNHVSSAEVNRFVDSLCTKA